MHLLLGTRLPGLSLQTKPMLLLYCLVPIHQDHGGLGTCLLKVSSPRILKSWGMATVNQIKENYNHALQWFRDKWYQAQLEMK